MRWIEQVIAAHKDDLLRRPPGRRAELIARWERSRSGEGSEFAVEMALRLIADGNVNEVELAFYVLMDLALTDPALRCHIIKLVNHRSASVRRSLAFYLSRQFPMEFQREILGALLRDKAASVRVKTIEVICMREGKELLPELRGLRSSEQNSKVIQSLNYWIPLLEVGYCVEPSRTPGMLEVTALTGHGIASRNVKAIDPNDPRIPQVVAELRRFP